MTKVFPMHGGYFWRYIHNTSSVFGIFRRIVPVFCYFQVSAHAWNGLAQIFSARILRNQQSEKTWRQKSGKSCLKNSTRRFKKTRSFVRNRTFNIFIRWTPPANSLKVGAGAKVEAAGIIPQGFTRGEGERRWTWETNQNDRSPANLITDVFPSLITDRSRTHAEGLTCSAVQGCKEKLRTFFSGSYGTI